MSWLSQLFKKSEQTPPAILPRKNDPCWCGSGIKYKKCHIAKDKMYLKEHPRKKAAQKKVAVKKSCSPVFG